MPRHILFWVSREETSCFYCGVAFLPSSSKYFFNSSNSRAYFGETAVGLEWILSLRKRRRSFRSAERRDSRSFNISASCSGDFPRSASRWIPVRSFRLSSFPPAFAFNSSRLTLERSRMESAADPAFSRSMDIPTAGFSLMDPSFVLAFSRNSSILIPVRAAA